MMSNDLVLGCYALQEVNIVISMKPLHVIRRAQARSEDLHGRSLQFAEMISFVGYSCLRRLQQP